MSLQNLAAPLCGPHVVVAVVVMYSFHPTMCYQDLCGVLLGLWGPSPSWQWSGHKTTAALMLKLGDSVDVSMGGDMDIMQCSK